MTAWACVCDERKKLPKERNWVVMDYRCNYSAFSGYHYTSSDYSAVRCNSCDKYWRTKARYVNMLPMARQSE